jgi:hypothetical protein
MIPYRICFVNQKIGFIQYNDFGSIYIEAIFPPKKTFIFFQKAIDKYRFIPYNVIVARQNNKKEGNKTMNYRTYNESNICKRTNMIFATYFRTKKEAKAYAEKIGGNYTIERKIGGNWVKC